MQKSDAQLMNDVVEELRWDPRLGRTEIGCAVHDGVVTLNGQVDSFVKKHAATRAAERVSGVKVVADELTVHLPSSLTRTDIDIAHAVADALRWDVEVPDEKVKARIENGWVTLEGDVEWDFERAAAERAVRYLTGVKGVSNAIRIVNRAFGPEVKQRIEGALKRSAELNASRVHVDAVDGHVTLKGSVRSSAARHDAERAAWSAPGVTSVRDELTVTA